MRGNRRREFAAFATGGCCLNAALTWVAIGVLGAAVTGLAFIVVQLMGQQGRLLLRLDELANSRAGHEHNGADPRLPALPVGTAVEPFRLASTNGGDVALEDFRDRKILLVHWSPDCGFCREIAGDLAELQGDLTKRETELLLLSYGEADANRALAEEHGLVCPIVLQDGSTQVATFRGFGTPAAYLVDEEGRIDSPLALGAVDVPKLAREAASGRRALANERPLAESRIERDGLRAGTPAPSFSLPDLNGEPVALEQYGGRRVLLVFSDPGCGPCAELLAELARLHAGTGQDEFAVLTVTRGGVDENRRKVEEHGVEFPVVLQPGWKLSKEYGIFATPVAFLIDEAGVIERDVARGMDEILSVARNELARKGSPMANV
jgi:peroxiredoxin